MTPTKVLIEQVKNKKQERTQVQQELNQVQQELSQVQQEIDALQCQIIEQLPGHMIPDLAHVVLDIPGDCPGWSMYAPINPPCVMCKHNIPCLNARRAIVAQESTAGRRAQ
jgi:hypothetical protein